MFFSQSVPTLTHPQMYARKTGGSTGQLECSFSKLVAPTKRGCQQRAHTVCHDKEGSEMEEQVRRAKSQGVSGVRGPAQWLRGEGTERLNSNDSSHQKWCKKEAQERETSKKPSRHGRQLGERRLVPLKGRQRTSHQCQYCGGHPNEKVGSRFHLLRTLRSHFVWSAA